MQYFQRSACGQFVDSSTTASGIAAQGCDPIKIAAAVTNDATDRNSSVGLARKSVENGFVPLGIEFVYDSSIGRTSELRRTVEVSCRVTEQVPVRIASICKTERVKHLESLSGRTAN